MIRLLTASAAIAATIVAGGIAFAHHTMTIYELFSTTIEGTVEQFRFTNPHCVIVLNARNENGTTTVWHLEGAPPATLAQAGFSRDTFHKGDHIKMEIHRLRSGKPGGLWNIRLVLTQNGHEFVGHQCMTSPDHCDSQ